MRNHHCLRSLFLAAAALAIAACAGDERDLVSRDGDDDADGDEYEPWDPKADGQDGLGGDISSTRACGTGPRLTIGAVGDILLHGPLQKQAVAQAAGDRFASLWTPIADLLPLPDLMYANFEGPSARGVGKGGRDQRDPGFIFDGSVYSSYPMFNYHAFLTEDLVTAGVDIVSTANNHSLDRRSLGADRTIEAMEAAGLPYIGTRRAGDDHFSSFWHFSTQNGIRMAWTACTFGTNGLPDTNDQVLGCWEDEAVITAAVRAIRAQGLVDLVVITPHWGSEYVATPSKDQRKLAQSFADAGVDLIIGSHPHVLEPWEKLTATDGREVFVIYSLGNFVSNQSQLPRRQTIFLMLEITKLADGLVQLSGLGYVPMIMRRSPYKIEPLEPEDASSDLRAITNMFGKRHALSAKAITAAGALALPRVCQDPTQATP